ncbi:MAG: flagellar biosynthetic protein FliP [Candidatus Midichloriaceae bacterium]|jgi:flagellar biosynthetic protein FliP
MLLTKNKNIFYIISVFALLMIFFSDAVFAQGIHIDLDSSGSEKTFFTDKIIQTIGLITILSLAPAILIMVTSFTKIVVVFSILRHALGLQQTPPNMVMISLSLFLTFFIMGPTFQKSYDNGLLPLINNQMTEDVAWEQITSPFKKFMKRNTREKDIDLFVAMSKEGGSEELQKDDLPMHVITPSFMLSELRRGFEIGFLIYLPFLIIDLVVASVLMGMGMMMLPPVVISLPFKLIFFVLIDGWYMLSGSLVKSYGIG